MAQVHNPYIVGSPVSGESGFYGREDIFDFVRATLSTPGQNVAVLYGQRRIGKTSILHQLPRHLPLEFAPVYFDLQGQERRPLPHVLYDLARRIARSLDLPTPTRDAFRRDGRFFQTDFLSQTLEVLGARRLVLLFDEFDVLGDDPLLAEDAFQSLFPYLQQLIQDRPQLGFVLVVGRRIDELPSRFGQIFKTAQFKPVSRLSSRDARRLVREPAQELLHYEDAAVNRILALTANHPYFTQLLCSVIFEQAQRLGSEMVTVGCVDDAIEPALERGEGGFGWMWDGLPGAERVILSAIASIADEMGSVNDKQSRQILEESNVRLLGLELTSAPQRLLEWDILAKAEDSSFHFAIDLVRCWVHHRHPLASTTRDLGYISQRAARLYENARDAHLAGDYETAIGDYRQALVVNPNHPWAPLGLAQALFEAGRLAEAVEAFEDAFQRRDEAARDGLVEAAYALANVYAEEKRWNEALRLFDRALALRPDRDDIRGAKFEAELSQSALLSEQRRKGPFGLAWGRATLTVLAIVGWILGLLVVIVIPFLPLSALGSPDAVALADALNLRDAPYTRNYNVIEILPKGTALSILGRSENGLWLYVKAPSGNIGWIANNPELVTVNVGLASISTRAPLPSPPLTVVPITLLAATIVASPIPSPTQVLSATPTRVPKTSTPSPTLQIVSYETPTATPTLITTPIWLTPTETFTPLPALPTDDTLTPIPTPTYALYSAPIPVAPDNGAGVQGVFPALYWAWDGELKEDEFFEVRIWQEDITTYHPALGWVKVPQFDYNIMGERRGKYYWTVVVVKGANVRPKDWTLQPWWPYPIWEGDLVAELSPEHEIRFFYYTPDDSGGPGGPISVPPTPDFCPEPPC